MGYNTGHCYAIFQKNKLLCFLSIIFYLCEKIYEKYTIYCFDFERIKC